MSIAKRWICLLLLSLLLAAPALGQGAPTQIEAALSDLGARLGRTVNIGDLSEWRWEQKQYADSALGCASVSGSGGALLGYEFRLTYRSVVYDYRVSADNSIVVYCGELDPNRAAAAPGAQYSNRLCDASASDGPYMRSSVIFGIEAEAAGGSVNLRGQPAADGQILQQVPAGSGFEVTAGPDCAEGYVWWLVNIGGQTGYIAEAGDGATFIKPKRPLSLPSREVLNSSLVAWLQELSRVEGNFQPQHVWSSDGVFIALPGARGSDSIWLYDLRVQPMSPQLLEYEAGISALAFRPNRHEIAFGSDDGALHLWRIEAASEPGYREGLLLNAHAGPVSAIAFSQDGERLVSAGVEAYTHADVDRNYAAIVWDLQTVAQATIIRNNALLIRAMSFSPDGALVAASTDSSTVNFWNANSGHRQRAYVFVDPVRTVKALDYADDGSMFAIALVNSAATVNVYDLQTDERQATYWLPTAQPTSVDFSPDGSMLVVGATEGLISIWNTRSQQLIVTRETGAAVRDVSFSPDGSLIAVSTEDHALSFYGVPLGSG